MDSDSRSSSPLFLVLLSGLFAALLGIRTQLPSASSPKAEEPRGVRQETKAEPKNKKPATGKETPTPPQGLAALLAEYRGPGQEGPAQSTADTSKEQKLNTHQNGPAATDNGKSSNSDPASIGFIIATVPDPIGSQFPNLFDSFLESIERAAQDAGYTLDRFDFPWTHDHSEQTSTSNEPAQAPWQEQPGVLLFRAVKGEKEDLVAIFLVGETPTAGVYKRAFEKALDQISDGTVLKKYGLKNRYPESIKILGPSFSGSTTSLRIVLKQWIKSKPASKIQIVSGSATAGELETLKINDKFSFLSVLLPDKDVIGAAKAYLKDYRRVALLIENGTSYGSTFQQWDGALQLPFPAHISALREAIEKQSANRSTSKTEKNVPAPLGEHSGGLAAPGAFSPFSLSSDELLLNTLLSELSRQRTQAVGIVATDLRDTVFLAQEVREHVPGTVIFTFDPDLIYTHSSRTWATYGMLVFGSYPLINQNQVWIAPEWNRKRILQFSGQGEEGVYNATLELLGQEAKMADHAPPFSGKCSDDHHAVWVTAVGREQILPVAIQCTSEFIPDPSKQGGQRRHASELYGRGHRLRFVLTSLAIMAFALTLCSLYYPHAFGNRRNRLRKLRPFRRLTARALGDPVSPQFVASSRMYLFTCCWVLLIFYLLIGLTFMGPGVAGLQLQASFSNLWKTAVFVLPVVTVVCLLAACIILWLAYGKAPQVEEQLRLPAAETIVRSMGAALLLILAVLYAGKPLWQALEAHETVAAPVTVIFRYVRAFNLSGGLSPLFPMFLVAAAALIWGFSSFRRVRTIDVLLSGAKPGAQVERCAFVGIDGPCCAGLAQIETKIQEMVERPWVVSTPIYTSIMGAMLSGYWYFVKWRLTPSIDGRIYDWLFATTFLLVYCALLLECIRVGMLWGSLRHYLKRLAAHPLRTAFMRYRESFPGLPKINFATPTPRLGLLEFSVEQAARLSSIASECEDEPALKQWAVTSRPFLCSALHNLSEAMAADAEDRARASLQQCYWVHRSLSNVVASLSPYLECHWRTGAGGTVPAATGNSQSQKFFLLAEEFVAGRAVEFIAYIVPSFRNMGAFVFSGLLLMLFAAVSYPFQPQDQFLLFNWIVVLACITGAMTVLVQMERDFILSSLNNTDPGKVNISRDLVLRFVLYGFIPLMALLGAQFPAQLQKITAMFSGGQGGISP